jgi:hypothetical protein
MIWRLSLLVAVLAAMSALAVGVPAAGASTTPTASFTTPFVGWPTGSEGPGAGVAGPCGSATGSEVQGRPGGTENLVCGTGLIFIAPAVGQIDSVVGPTIISPAVVGASIVTGNNVAVP